MEKLSLAIIYKDEVDAVIDLCNQLEPYVSQFVITNAAKTKSSYYELQKKFDNPKLKLSYFKWCDHFGKAREFNREQIETDYFIWLDTDDVVQGLDKLEELVVNMMAAGLDAVYLRYDYQKNDLNESTGDHWRERIVRTKHFKWAQTRCHETLIAPAAATARDERVVVLHSKTLDQQKDSLLRNIKLLLQDFDETKDPRVAMYLGDNLMTLEMYQEAVKYLLYLVENGGWDEDKYRAWLKIGEIYYKNQDYERSLNACFEAEKLLPEFPDAYYLKATVYNALNQPKKVFEWVKVAMLKPVPETLSVIDPTLYEYRGLFMGALAALELGKVEDAYKLLKIVRERSPEYELARKMEPLFEEAYYDGKAIDTTKWLVYYLKENKGNPEKILAALPNKLFADPRLNAIRATILPTKTWGKGSIAFFCGASGEPWGADTLEKGMGGSEEAVVYLSRELAKLGHEMTVFNDREEEYLDIFKSNNAATVTYKPWTLLNPNDTFDIFIAWRAPENIRGVNARVKLVDLHDTIQPERVYSVAELEPECKFMVKSQYHRSLYPELPDNRFVVIGNGIIKEQFNDN